MKLVFDPLTGRLVPLFIKEKIIERLIGGGTTTVETPSETPSDANVEIGPDFGEAAGSNDNTFGIQAAVGMSEVDVAGNNGVGVGVNDSQYVLLYPTPSSRTLTVPPTITSAKLECWGGGGGGGTSVVNGGGGGGGAGYASTTLAVTPGNVLTIRIGAPGSIAGAGGDSWVSNTGVAPTSVAEGALSDAGNAGGNGNAGGQGAGGTGGTTNIGDTTFNGGAGGGGAAVQTNGGGGGEGAGDAANGNNGASNRTGGTGTGGADGGTGGGGIGQISTPGNEPGAGGGGASTTEVASTGANGRVIITLTKA